MGYLTNKNGLPIYAKIFINNTEPQSFEDYIFVDLVDTSEEAEFGADIYFGHYIDRESGLYYTIVKNDYGMFAFDGIFDNDICEPMDCDIVPISLKEYQIAYPDFVENKAKVNPQNKFINWKC